VSSYRDAIIKYDKWPVGFSLPPDGETVLPMGAEEPTITPQQIATGSFYLIGCMIYFDAYAIKHVTAFCFTPRKALPRTTFATVNDMEFVLCNAFQRAN
jgi:hypothetical protein